MRKVNIPTLLLPGHMSSAAPDYPIVHLLARIHDVAIGLEVTTEIAHMDGRALSEQRGGTYGEDLSNFSNLGSSCQPILADGNYYIILICRSLETTINKNVTSAIRVNILLVISPNAPEH